MNTELEKIEKLKQSKQNLLDKNFKILFFLAESEIASAAIYEIYNQVKILRELGYDAKILTDKKDYQVPDFLDSDLKALPHICTEGQTFTVSPEDYLIVPELFTNIMEQVKNLSCEKIVLMQNLENAMRGLVPGTTWSDFNFRNVITTNEPLANLTKDYLCNNAPYDIQKYTIGVPDYFKKTAKPKNVVISYYTRNYQEIEKVIKLFYLKFPHYRFVSFEDLRDSKQSKNGRSRTDFAKKLNDSFAVLWLDRIASFGTTPVEAMTVGTIPIGLVPEIIPEYIATEVDGEYKYKDSGFWTNDVLTIPDLIAEAVKLFIQDIIPERIYQSMDEEAAFYTAKISKESIIKTYTYFFDKRAHEFQYFIDNNLNKNIVAPTELIETIEQK